MRNDIHRTHREVSSDYEKRIEARSTDHLVSPAELGYTEDDRSALPEGLTGASFGCGNPVAFSYVQPGDTVLDLGSGAGLDLLLARQRTGPEGRVIGVDMTDAMLDRARANIQASGYDNVEVRKGIIEALPVDTGSVDWVISNCVVNLSPDKARVFGEIARVLRPGGQLLISDIVVGDVPLWARAVTWPFNRAVARARSEADYVKGLQRVGLHDVHVVDRLVYDEASISAMVRSELDLPGRPWARFGRWLEKPIASAVADRVTSIRLYARRTER